jgi:hypothetical protein
VVRCSFGVEFDVLYGAGHCLLFLAKTLKYNFNVIAVIGVVGVDFDGLSVAGHCLFTIDECRTKVIVVQYVFGVDFDGFSVAGHSFLTPFKALE